MRRREFITLLGGAPAAWPFAARAQQPAKVPRIGWLLAAPLENPEARPLRDAFWQGMRELGWVEGQNIVVEYRSAEGRLERFPELAAELVRLKVDLIVAGNTAAVRAAGALTTTIPIVCFNFSDLIGEGLVASLARPGGNVTGFTLLAPELVPKCLSLLKEAVPKASRIAALWQPGNQSERTVVVTLQQAETAARTLGVELQPVRVQLPEDLDSAFATMAQTRTEALLLLPSQLSFGENRRIADLARGHRLPSMSWRREFAEAGGLMAYGANFNDSWRRGATYVDKILKGASPGDLPVQHPTKSEFVINMKTARALGLTIPLLVLGQADEVIE